MSIQHVGDELPPFRLIQVVLTFLLHLLRMIPEHQLDELFDELVIPGRSSPLHNRLACSGRG